MSALPAARRASSRGRAVSSFRNRIIDDSMIRDFEQSADSLPLVSVLERARVAERDDRALRDDSLRVCDVLLIRHGLLR